ncbi:uncharacterized protein C8A04DRAFT_25813 [Dichotomopilus funicola]|uniref:Uncharacterized protein n=1 Tax=Dichotomopilus funicola TaxID=1934379 RepID=A0AAN6V8F0_9PEZI|nr:hypothetical protein C8A04DRAFT_25813 [Dichotomopilus funicola]
MESVFNDAEKRFVLAEMIKLSELDVGVLVNLIKSHGIQPDWMHMQLPGGRNMSQCVHAAEVMFDTPMPPPIISSLKRKSLGDLPDPYPKRQAVASPGEVSPRGFTPGSILHQQPPPPPPVNIQQRPNGYSPALPAPAPPAVTSPYNPTPPPRKRGRPPKSAQSAWQNVTPAHIAPSPAPTGQSQQPHSPGLQTHTTYQHQATQGHPEVKRSKKPLPEIAPRPTQGMAAPEPSLRSPAMSGGEFQSWREETGRRDNYQLLGAEGQARDRPLLPRPRSPLPPARDLMRAGSAEPRRFASTPPPSATEPVKKESQPAIATTEPFRA